MKYLRNVKGLVITLDDFKWLENKGTGSSVDRMTALCSLN